VRCWGDNTYGQLGDSSTRAHLRPAPVKGVTHVVAIAAGAGGSCAIDAEAALWCWGAIASDFKARNTPTKMLDGVASVSLGGDHACVLMKAGDVRCWGGNGEGQLGDGSRAIHRDAPGPVALP
jgi:alpha-tubulin suppressor-like RCC1 family protein